MSYLVNLKLEGKRALVVGAGSVAHRKVVGLLEAGAGVTVVSLQCCEEIRQLAASGALELHLRGYEETDLGGAFLVVAATSDEALNARIGSEAQTAGILVNVVDRPAHCTFTLPAVVRRGALTIAVATDGRCPALSRVIREQLDEEFGPEYAEVVEVAARLRESLIRKEWPSERIRRALGALYRDGLPEAVAAGDEQRLQALLRKHLVESLP
jgi:precorrin-2 dehydrogenase/sirohydrochlorin ferrochelatase